MPESNTSNAPGFSNNGNPETTALLIAFELMKKKSDLTGLSDVQLSQKLGEMANNVLSPIRVLRPEPSNDPNPGCAEPPASACDWPKGEKLEADIFKNSEGLIKEANMLSLKEKEKESEPKGPNGFTTWETLGFQK